MSDQVMPEDCQHERWCLTGEECQLRRRDAGDVAATAIAAPARDVQMAETWCFHPGHEHGVDGARLDHCRAARRVVPIAPDPARDARVAARRAVDARRAGCALDKLLQGQGQLYDARVLAGAEFVEALGDYLESRLQHNRNYGVAEKVCRNRLHRHGPDDPWLFSCSGGAS